MGKNFQKRATARLVARALRPPPRPALRSGKRFWPPQRLWIRDREMTNRQLASANTVPPSGVAGLKQSLRRIAVTKAEQESTNSAVPGGWPGTAFDFLEAKPRSFQRIPEVLASDSITFVTPCGT
ncbi:MAG: hypothetical protein ABSG34_10610 [Candidatus Sulfotelmatobacter sp.]